MATILNGILGGFSGKVGTVIGASWNGIDYMRSRATSITQPNTPAQLEQRARFSLIVKFLQTMTAFLRVGFKSQAIKMTGFNAALKYNIANVITGVYPALAIDFEKVKVSEGSLPGALNPAITSTVEGVLDVTWDNNSTEAGASPDDKVMLVVFNPTRQLSVTVAGGSTRITGSHTLTLPDNFVGETVECYIGFQNANQSEVSDSQYVNSVIVA